jgi:hypothetical protein
MIGGLKQQQQRNMMMVSAGRNQTAISVYKTDYMSDNSDANSGQLPQTKPKVQLQKQSRLGSMNKFDPFVGKSVTFDSRN